MFLKHLTMVKHDLKLKFPKIAIFFGGENLSQMQVKPDSTSRNYRLKDSELGAVMCTFNCEKFIFNY